jgi:hypothetical protein
MNILKSIALVAIVLVANLVSSTTLYSQNESGTRNIGAYENMLKGRHSWYDTSTAMYQHQFPIIRSIPPLSITMPFNVLLSYIYTDSLLRFTPRTTLTNRINSWSSLNDTLKWMVYGDYVMSDYNPIIYSQFWQETANWRIANTSIRTDSPDDTLPAITGKYNASYNSIKPKLDVKIAQVLPDSISKAIMSLLTCEYILKIKVISIDSMIDKLSSGSFPDSYYYRVTAIVYDTIKGKILPPAPIDSQEYRKKNNIPLENSYGIIQFGYTNRAYQSLWSSGDGKFRYSEPDSAFIRGVGTEFSMKLNQEAIVFLTYFNNKIDYQHDYFDLSLDPLASFNALPIIDGDVRDVNKVWSQNLLMPYSSWKNRANELITKILTRNY